MAGQALLNEETERRQTLGLKGNKDVTILKQKSTKVDWWLTIRLADTRCCT